MGFFLFFLSIETATKDFYRYGDIFFFILFTSVYKFWQVYPIESKRLSRLQNYGG